MARTVEDVLARRMRILFLDAKASIKAAPIAAEIIAEELGFSKKWQDEQVALFTHLAKEYLLN